MQLRAGVINLIVGSYQQGTEGAMKASRHNKVAL